MMNFAAKIQLHSVKPDLVRIVLRLLILVLYILINPDNMD